ncbi:hypothetical protein C8J57DRAFT_1305684 [Mycena rebaudengoi]|nr:hypothetical protein C8J57DRAFT_1305684 [Mycena rebaudengoi]
MKASVPTGTITLFLSAPASPIDLPVRPKNPIRFELHGVEQDVHIDMGKSANSPSAPAGRVSGAEKSIIETQATVFHSESHQALRKEISVGLLLYNLLPSHLSQVTIQAPGESTLENKSLGSEGLQPLPPKILVYQSLYSFISGAAFCLNSPIASTLQTHYETMSAPDPVLALLKSRESRSALLQMSSDLGVADDPKLREALREDEQRVAKRLVAILDSKSEKEAVLLLDGDSAQDFLDVVQNVALDRGFLIKQEHTSKARKILLQLSEACDKLPSSLFITGVSECDQEPMFGGGFGDIYRASYAGKTVALKHMRTFQRGADLRRLRLRQQFCREALVWQSLRHPHILPLIGIDRESFPMSLCMVSPWMEHGTVLKYLEEHGRRNVDKLLSEIALGLQYLHSRNVVHGDLRGVISFSVLHF